MRILFIICIFSLLVGCSTDSSTEIYQNSRNNIVDVSDRVVEIPIEYPLISSYAYMQIVNEYIVLADWKGYDKLIHLIDKNSFHHVVSTTSMGQGPYEIAHIGDIVPDEEHNKFYVFDQGKRKLFNFDLDSLIADSTYRFTVKTDLLEDYPIALAYIEDTFSLALFADFDMKTGGANVFSGSWNMITKEFKKGYENPYVRKKRYQFAASKESGVYVTTSSRYDLMTICYLDGSLKCNVYGPNWNEKITKMCHYNLGLCIGDNKIFALYSGEDHRSEKTSPSKVIVFDIDGNYLKTLETGLRNLEICYDKDNHRLIFYTDSEMQFGYLDLEGIV